ncbi:general stress protein [Amycolatopsis aidingensis]|uniref:general stress protein n=1 Tax=Amycolatopsis aidingensis TaxID=2842453 RepID=UPI001C0E1AA8|nr:general stress protein [Amycolatopsis aidingensis]
MARTNETTAPATPQQVVASYPSYQQIEQAVDYLSDQHFPVERTMIVGRGMELVERVTGRLTMLRAAGRSAGPGAVVGALIGWLFGWFGWLDPLIASLLLALYGAVFGAVIGALLGLIGHALTGGRRDFSSIPSFRARSHDLLVDTEVAEQASNLLRSEGAPGTGEAPVPR